MSGDGGSIDEVLDALTETPARITALIDGLTPRQVRTAPSPGEWSANDILAHLRACADTWGANIATILTKDHPTIRAVSPRSSIKRTNYLDLDFGPSFEAFASQRTDLLVVLKSLSPEQWECPATEIRSGRPTQQTVRTFAERLANQERLHVQQIGQVVDAIRAA